MKIIEFIGIVTSFTGFLVMFITFMWIFFGNDGIADINRWGEANFEFVLLVILLPCVIYSFFMGIKHIAESGY